MSLPRRVLPALVAAALVAGACGSDPIATQPPSETPRSSPTPTPLPAEIAFRPASWPAAGTACADPAYGGLIGRIEAPDAGTVRFRLCRPDGAFRARLAHPAMAILDASTIARLAEDRSSATSIAGTGGYRIDHWVDGDNVVLERVAAESSATTVAPTIVLRWEPSADARTSALEDASVDVIDGPGPVELDRIATQPELVVTPRAGLATAFLAFGSGSSFSGTRVRRAIGSGIDRAALTASAFPAGSAVPTHMSPCIMSGGCAGHAWYEYNAPAAVAALAEAKFNLAATYTLHIPDEPVPGLPDPAGTAEALRTQLADNLGLKVKIDAMPLDAFRAAVDAGTLSGLYLDGIATSLADPTGILAPLFGAGVTTTPAKRLRTVPAMLDEAAATADPAARLDAITRANDAIRSGAVVVPLAHPGSVVASRSDVSGVATSPLGLDPLGAVTAGDRPQVAFMQAATPDGAYCGDQADQDAIRLCGLVSDGLYGFDAGAIDPLPRLAQRCDANSDATVWTCRLRPGRTFSDGMQVDAGDVLASFVAQWDRTQPLRMSEPDATFAAWDELFGGTLGGG